MSLIFSLRVILLLSRCFWVCRSKIPGMARRIAAEFTELIPAEMSAAPTFGPEATTRFALGSQLDTPSESTHSSMSPAPPDAAQSQDLDLESLLRGALVIAGEKDEGVLVTKSASLVFPYRSLRP